MVDYKEAESSQILHDTRCSMEKLKEFLLKPDISLAGINHSLLVHFRLYTTCKYNYINNFTSDVIQVQIEKYFGNIFIWKN